MIPLSLYIHIPWCVQKCPYCDFNSHQYKGELPEKDYFQHLINDFKQDLLRYSSFIQDRKIHSIFIGGGTPSLMNASSFAWLFEQIQTMIPFEEKIEITMEANPGSVEAHRFEDFVAAGITRLSLGVQSFNDDKLQRLGRIHNADQAKKAITVAKSLVGKGLKSFNLDLMHGLPHQNVEEALMDLKTAISFQPPHISWYQLTIEPNTKFGSRPPVLPDDEILWQIFEQGHQLLADNGYQQYETSAYAKPGFQCEHNLNYWRFGDYLAIGCGSHGKLSTFIDNQLNEIIRYNKTKHPKGYLMGDYLYQQEQISHSDRPFEFFMNRFRLLEAVPKEEFIQRTGMALKTITPIIESAKAKGFVKESQESWQVTDHGKLFLNELLTLFLD